MRQDELSEKNANKYRKLFPGLHILKVTAWNHDKALWCKEGLFIYKSGKLILDEDFNGYGRYIGNPGKFISWDSIYGGGVSL